MFEPLRLSTPGIDFEELNELRQFLERMLERSRPSLRLYCDPLSGGFVHLRNTKGPGDFSRTSTATVVAFLTRSGQWNVPAEPWSDKAQNLVDSILDQPFESSGLREDNPFTTAFLLEAVADLCDHAGARMSTARGRVFRSKMRSLASDLGRGRGIAMEPYPPTSFMTQKALRVVKRRLVNEELLSRALVGARDWAWLRLYEESVAVSSGQPDSDIFELGYAALSASMTTTSVDMTPKQRTAMEWALSQFFAAQGEDGMWPRSQPLFHYPDYGDAYCYDYEFLVQLLQEEQLAPVLHDNVPSLARAAYALDSTKVPLNSDGAIGWASGHLKQRMGAPESWTSASAYHFCYLLHRLVVEAIRRAIFAYTGNRYTQPKCPDQPGAIDRSAFLDSPIVTSAESDPLSLTRVLEDRFLAPLAAELGDASRGLPVKAKRSAILYGPPGTSKTKLAELIASALGWPLLKLDPSHLTKEGLDRLHAETNRIFTMLEAGEQMVVLLDEFDELVRDRDVEGTESASRFLTTAMLPKLTALYNRQRIVFLVATNHVERFDPAIARHGRFDMIVPVLPPTLEEKLIRWPSVRDHLKAARLMGADAAASSVRDVLTGLTYGEFEEAVSEICAHDRKAECAHAVIEIGKKSTMRQNVTGDGDATWASRMEHEQSRIRIPTVQG